MVTRAWGTANGYEVVLSRQDGDRWAFTVPSLPDGTHIVMDLMAEDEAGNIGYLATILIAARRHQMQVRILHKGYSVEIKKTGYSASVRDTGYTASISGKGYKAVLRERGYRIDRILCHSASA